MATVLINDLTEQTTAQTDDLLIVQDGSDTKKMLVSTLKTLTDSGLSAHIADTTDAHAASAITAAPAGPGQDATTVQGQLGQIQTTAASSVTAINANATSLSNHFASTTAHAAANITADATGRTYFTGANLDVQLDAGDAALGTHVNSTTAHAAASISADSTGRTYITGSNVDAQLDAADTALRTLATATGAPVRRPLNNQVGTTYAVVAADENTMITLSNAAAITVTLPSDATSPCPIGTEIDFVWLGVGQPTFAAGSGATLNATPSPKLRAQYAVGTAKKISTNGWLLFGDLV